MNESVRSKEKPKKTTEMCRAHVLVLTEEQQRDANGWEACGVTVKPKGCAILILACTARSFAIRVLVPLTLASTIKVQHITGPYWFVRCRITFHSPENYLHAETISALLEEGGK